MLKLLVVASEAFPLAKTGGLGDAVSGMARALQQCGADVIIMVPAYRNTVQQLHRVKTLGRLDGLPGGSATLLAGRLANFGLNVLLLRNDALYDRDGSLYLDAQGNEHADNGVRYAALAHAATRIAAGRLPGWTPDIVHANDWHAGLTPLLMSAAGITRVKSVMTIHNLAFQGVFPMSDAGLLGIPEAFQGPDGAEYWGKISFLKAGLKFADRITTVSRNYAREILSPAFGMGLDSLLREREADLLAIPNGIDTHIWNPESDGLLPANYSVHELSGKATCKRELQQAFGLDVDPHSTLVVAGSRLTSQKMGDIVAQIIAPALERHEPLQFAILGCGERYIEDALSAAVARFPGRAALQIGYNERLAHLLHGGGDILLHGSRFEPFGLTPIYAMRYGTIPICSCVGGMVDTVDDPGPHAGAHALACASGILFKGDTPQDMLAAIDRAMALRAHRRVWAAMQRHGMTGAYGWLAPARQYLALYHSLLPAQARSSRAPAPKALPSPPVRLALSHTAATRKTAKTRGLKPASTRPEGLAPASA